MEPLDPKLARKYAATISGYIPKQVENYNTKSKIPDALNERITWYVNEARKARDPEKRKKDIANADLTVHNLRCIERSTGISFDELRQTYRRDALYSLARSIFTYIERRINNRSYPEIAAILNADHTSCMHMIDKFRRGIEDTKLFRLVMRDEEMYMLFDRARRWKRNG